MGTDFIFVKQEILWNIEQELHSTTTIHLNLYLTSNYLNNVHNAIDVQFILL